MNLSGQITTGFLSWHCSQATISAAQCTIMPLFLQYMLALIKGSHPNARKFSTTAGICRAFAFKNFALNQWYMIAVDLVKCVLCCCYTAWGDVSQWVVWLCSDTQWRALKQHLEGRMYSRHLFVHQNSDSTCISCSMRNLSWPSSSW